MSDFNEFVGKLKKEGYSDPTSRKIAYKEGVKSLGKAEMERRSIAGKKKAEKKKG